MDGSVDDRRWHQALVFALTGERRPALGVQSTPDVAQLLADLETGEPGGLAAVRERVRDRRAHPAGSGWPLPVPGDLGRGLGAAQFAAVLRDLVDRLEVDVRPRPTLSSRAPDVAEQRLLRDVPPHHGS